MTIDKLCHTLAYIFIGFALKSSGNNKYSDRYVETRVFHFSPTAAHESALDQSETSDMVLSSADPHEKCRLTKPGYVQDCVTFKRRWKALLHGSYVIVLFTLSSSRLIRWLSWQCLFLATSEKRCVLKTSDTDTQTSSYSAQLWCKRQFQ